MVFIGVCSEMLRVELTWEGKNETRFVCGLEEKRAGVENLKRGHGIYSVDDLQFRCWKQRFGKVRPGYGYQYQANIRTGLTSLRQGGSHMQQASPASAGEPVGLGCRCWVSTHGLHLHAGYCMLRNTYCVLQSVNSLRTDMRDKGKDTNKI